jgi:hypothetical protein
VRRGRRRRKVGGAAGLDAAREGVAYTEIRAPYWGRHAKHVQVGEAVAPGTLMTGARLTRASSPRCRRVIEQVRQVRKAVVYVGDRRIESTDSPCFRPRSRTNTSARASSPAT